MRYNCSSSNGRLSGETITVRSICHSVNELDVYDTGMLFSLMKAVLLNRTTKIIIKIKISLDG